MCCDVPGDPSSTATHVYVQDGDAQLGFLSCEGLPTSWLCTDHSFPVALTSNKIGISRRAG